MQSFYILFILGATLLAFAMQGYAFIMVMWLYIKSMMYATDSDYHTSWKDAVYYLLTGATGFMIGLILHPYNVSLLNSYL